MDGWIEPEEAARHFKSGTGKGVKIAVIDSGIETSHRALKGLKLADDVAIVEDGFQVQIEPGEGRDVFGHGTGVAGILRELAPEAQIGSFRVLGPRLDSRTALIAEGVRQAMERGYHIINCSFGCGVEKQVLQYKSWVDEAYLRGIHLVAACNNYDFTKPEWPGYFPSVITVNMAKGGGERFYHRPGHLVEFAAPGVDLQVAWLDGTMKKVSGSSFAAPHIAGLVARLLSKSPGLPPLHVKALLQNLASPWTRKVAASNVPR